MLLLLPALAILAFYFYFNGLNGLNIHVISAIVIMGIYLTLLYLIPPSGLQYSSARMGGLYMHLPLVSFGALVFSGNDDGSEEQKWCLVIFGWLGLMTALACLIFFKFYYW